MMHVLKTWPEYFEAICEGRKTFEVRKEDDKTFKVGDILWLREYDPEIKQYANRDFFVRVTYILRDPKFVKKGYVIMGIRRV